MRNGTHHHLTKSDLALWALLIVSLEPFFSGLNSDLASQCQQHDSAKMDTPPTQLKLEDARPVKFGSSVNPGLPPPNSYSTHAQLPPPFPYYGYPPPYYRGLHPDAYAQPPGFEHVAPDITTAEDPTQFPFIKDWLLRLDEGQRGADGHGFSQYIQAFKANHIHCIFEIASLDLFSRDDLLVICPGMKIGTANLLLRYAREDTESIRNEEKRKQQNAKRMRYY